MNFMNFNTKSSHYTFVCFGISLLFNLKLLV